MVRVCRWKEVMAGEGRSSSSSESSAGDSTFRVDVAGGAGEVVWEASKMPRLPSLSPAKRRGLEGEGWKARE